MNVGRSIDFRHFFTLSSQFWLTLSNFKVSIRASSVGLQYNLMPHILDPVTDTILNTPVVILCTTVILIFAGLYEIFGLQFMIKLGDKQTDQLKQAKQLCLQTIEDKSCAPILLRLAWHDCATYDKDKSDEPWPEAGGAVGSVRTLRGG
jgi:hypothetical protein